MQTHATTYHPIAIDDDRLTPTALGAVIMPPYLMPVLRQPQIHPRHGGFLSPQRHRRERPQPLRPFADMADLYDRRPDRVGPATYAITSHYRVMVVLQSHWTPLLTLLCAHEGTPLHLDAQRALDTLAVMAAPQLACQALAAYAEAHMQHYQQQGIQHLTFHALPSEQQNDIPVWGDLVPTDLVAEVAATVDTATRARAALPRVPADMFWPIEGAFFSAADESPQISSHTRGDIITHPERYVLLDVLMIVESGSTTLRPRAVVLPGVDHTGGWRLCRHCGRASQHDEYIAWDTRWYCPYAGCGGEIGRDTWAWNDARIADPSLPIAPQKWVIYQSSVDGLSGMPPAKG